MAKFTAAIYFLHENINSSAVFVRSNGQCAVKEDSRNMRFLQFHPLCQPFIRISERMDNDRHWPSFKKFFLTHTWPREKNFWTQFILHLQIPARIWVLLMSTKERENDRLEPNSAMDIEVNRNKIRLWTAIATE